MLVFKINKKSNSACGFSSFSRQLADIYHSYEEVQRAQSEGGAHCDFSICAGLREWGGWCAERKSEGQGMQSSQQCLDFGCGLASTRSICASAILTLFHHSFTLHDVCATSLFWTRMWGSWRPGLASPQIFRRP